MYEGGYRIKLAMLKKWAEISSKEANAREATGNIDNPTLGISYLLVPTGIGIASGFGIRSLYARLMGARLKRLSPSPDVTHKTVLTDLARAKRDPQHQTKNYTLYYDGAKPVEGESNWTNLERPALAGGWNDKLVP